MRAQHTPGRQCDECEGFCLVAAPLPGLFFNGSEIRAPKTGPIADSPDFPGSLVVARLCTDAMPDARVHAATGRAMAAASELLAVAQEIESLLTNQKWNPDGLGRECRILAAARAAIAKATGSAS